MTAYWITFADRSKGCVEAASLEEAIKLAKEIASKDVLKADRLPYPAAPRLNTYLHEFSNGKKVACPSFCYTPDECAGHSSCRNDYACSE